jgi:hypothetical protein
MQTDTRAIHDSIGDRKIINELFGGLAITPYGIFLILSGVAFALGWLDWKTNNGPPFLGGVFAWIIERLIKKYYQKKYSFSFMDEKETNKYTRQPIISDLFAGLLVAGLLLAWFVEVQFHPQIRLMPLLFGGVVCWRGIDWMRKEWKTFGLIHFLLGCILVGMSFAPLILNVSTETAYFGFEGIYELILSGIVIIIIGIMEHMVFLSVRNSDFELAA